jgi:hypothetical protein
MAPDRLMSGSGGAQGQGRTVHLKPTPPVSRTQTPTVPRSSRQCRSSLASNWSQ